MQKIITVFGSTGQQGGGVVQGLLDRRGFEVRGVTRNPDSDKAKKLADCGVKIVQADLDDPASVNAAVSGSHGVFLVTNYADHFDKERDIRQGKCVADACKKAEVKHVVYSGLESVMDSIGKSCTLFDCKVEIEKYMDAIGLPKTCVIYSLYYENFLSPGFGFQKQEDGSYNYTHCMDGQIFIASVKECGSAVAAIFSQPEEFIGKKIAFCGDKLSLKEIVEIVSKATGKTLKQFQVSPDEFAQFPFPGAAELAAMLDCFARGNLHQDIALTKQLNPKTTSFQEWVDANKDNFAF